MLIAYGILCWSRKERRTLRYGAFYLDHTNYEGATAKAYTLDFSELAGERVLLTAKIINTRESGHCGDAALGVKPSTPTVGEVIEIGVGTLYAGTDDNHTTIGLSPNDGRQQLHIDPRVLYRLHDQTVEIHAEKTDRDFTVVQDFGEIRPSTIVNDDGTIQYCMVPEDDLDDLVLVPRFVHHGDGLFSMETNIRPGDSLKVQLEKTGEQVTEGNY